MHLSEIRLWNFRKYGVNGSDYETSSPGIIVNFNKALNVLIGENDSGKSALIDAIKLILLTHSGEWIGLTQEDFYKDRISPKNEN